MEESKEYTAFTSFVSSLEEQMIEIVKLQQQQDFNVVKSGIEEHFERCIHAMEARRHTLLSELEQIVQQQGGHVEVIKQHLTDLIKSCHTVIENGSYLYKQNNINEAEQIWQASLQGFQNKVSANDMQKIPVKVAVHFPPEFLTTIDAYGTVSHKSVTLTSSFHLVSSATTLLQITPPSPEVPDPLSFAPPLAPVSPEPLSIAPPVIPTPSPYHGIALLSRQELSEALEQILKSDEPYDTLDSRKRKEIEELMHQLVLAHETLEEVARKTTEELVTEKRNIEELKDSLESKQKEIQDLKKSLDTISPPGRITKPAKWFPVNSPSIAVNEKSWHRMAVTPVAASAPVLTYTGAMFSAAELRNMRRNPASAFEAIPGGGRVPTVARHDKGSLQPTSKMETRTFEDQSEVVLMEITSTF